MDLEIGGPVLMETIGTKDRSKCTFIGFSKHEYVVLRIPLSPGIRSRVAEGSVLVFRYLHQGRLIGFRAQVLHYLATPFSLLFVSYPSKTESHELRRDQRMSCQLLSEVQVGVTNYPGLVLDLSPGGCRFLFDHRSKHAPTKLGTGEIVSGKMMLPVSPQSIAFAASVVAVSREGGWTTLGLRFDHENTAFPDELVTYIRESTFVMDKLAEG